MSTPAISLKRNSQGRLQRMPTLSTGPMPVYSNSKAIRLRGDTGRVVRARHRKYISCLIFAIPSAVILMTVSCQLSRCWTLIRRSLEMARGPKQRKRGGLYIMRAKLGRIKLRLIVPQTWLRIRFFCLDSPAVKQSGDCT